MSLKIILLAVLLIVSPISSFATDYLIAASDLNVRTGAGRSYSISFTLKKGDEVELLSKGNSWYKVKYLGKTGYANSKYLEFGRTISGTDLNSKTVRLFVNNLLIIAYVSLIIFIALTVFRRIRDKKLLQSITDKKRGTKSERDLVLMLLKSGIAKQNIFHDLYLVKRKAEFSQIDLVVITKVGIIVFEVKDYSGWIFGNGNQSQWTQVLAYGKKKFFFYNPIMQNNRHIVELGKQLNRFQNIPFYSLVVFYGNCELKNINFVPNGTFIVKANRVLEVVRNIERDNKPFSYSNENEAIRILSEAVTNGGNIENQIQHSESIKDMLGTHRVYS